MPRCRHPRDRRCLTPPSRPRPKPPSACNTRSVGATPPCPTGVPVTALGFSTDGTRLVAGAGDGSHLCWELTSDELAWRTPPGGAPVAAIAWLPRDEFAAVLLARGSVQALNTATGGPVRSGESNRDERGTRLALSADGRLVAIGGTDGVVRVDDVAAGRTVWTFETGADEVTSVEFLPEGSGVRTCGTDGFIRRWSLATGMEEAPWSTGYTYRLRTIGSLDGSRLLVTNGHKLELWSDRSPEALVWSRWSTNGSFTLPCFCDPHGQILYINNGMTNEGENRPQCAPLDAETGEFVGQKARFFWSYFITMQETRRGPLSLSYAGADGPSGRASEFRVVEEWSPRRRQAMPHRGRFPVVARFSTDGRRFATATTTHVDLYELHPVPAWIGTVDLSSLDDTVDVLALSEDGSVVAVGTHHGRTLVFAVERLAVVSDSAR